MTAKVGEIIYQIGRYTVRVEPFGYGLYQDGPIATMHVGRFGHGDKYRDRAIVAAKARHIEDTNG